MIQFWFRSFIWDRIFHTYKSRPEKTTEEMEIGLNWQDEKPQELGWSLGLPFKKMDNLALERYYSAGLIILGELQVT